MENMKESRSFSYGVFSLITDEMRGTSIPVGVVLWTRNEDLPKIKLARESDHIKGLDQFAYHYIHQMHGQLNEWITSGELPYRNQTTRSKSDEWWRHVRSLLVHKLRMSEPRPIDCKNPDDELEPLYEAVVGPRRSVAERSARIDRVLSAALGALSRKLDRGSVAGYHGRRVQVRHFKASRDRLLVVEGVNLASIDAEEDVDALVSRLLRIRASGDGPASVVTYVGYLASPNGLNGEAALVDWIKERAEAHTFDLLGERETFNALVDDQLAAFDSQGIIH